MFSAAYLVTSLAVAAKCLPCRTGGKGCLNVTAEPFYSDRFMRGVVLPNCWSRVTLRQGGANEQGLALLEYLKNVSRQLKPNIDLKVEGKN